MHRERIFTRWVVCCLPNTFVRVTSSSFWCAVINGNYAGAIVYTENVQQDSKQNAIVSATVRKIALAVYESINMYGSYV